MFFRQRRKIPTESPSPRLIFRRVYFPDTGVSHHLWIENGKFRRVTFPRWKFSVDLPSRHWIFPLHYVFCMKFSGAYPSPDGNSPFLNYPGTVFFQFLQYISGDFTFPRRKFSFVYLSPDGNIPFLNHSGTGFFQIQWCISGGFTVPRRKFSFVYHSRNWNFSSVFPFPAISAWETRRLQVFQHQFQP